MSELIYEYWFIFVGIFVVIAFNHKRDTDPTILREDEKEGRAKSWLFGFIKSSSDNEEIIEHGRTDEGYSIKTKNKYSEETDYIISNEDE